MGTGLEREIVKALKGMEETRIPIEINLRSNEYLVLGANNQNADIVRIFNGEHNIPIILCTDNDGIMDIATSFETLNLRSVAAEYAYAIQNVIVTENKLSEFIGKAKNSAFERIAFDMSKTMRKTLKEKFRTRCLVESEGSSSAISPRRGGTLDSGAAGL